MTTLRVFRGLLSNRPLVQLLSGELVSSIGDWLYLVALLVVVYEQSNDPLLLGVVGAARVLPYVLLSIPAGIVADRFDRRLVLLVTDVARGLIMLAMAWLVAIHAPLWSIVGLAILATCFSCFFGPTIGSYLPTLVRDERELGPANSAWSTLDNLAFVVGPALAGLLIGASGLTFAFLLNALSFGVVAIVLWRLPSAKPGGEPEAASAAADEPGPAPRGGRFAAIRPHLVPLTGLTAVEMTSSFVFGGLSVLTVVLAIDQLHAGDAGTGYLNAADGFGGVVGALGAGFFVVRPALRVPLVIGSIALAIGVAALGAITTLGPALVAMALAEAGALISGVVSTTIFQRIIPDAIRGRALGAMATLSMLAYSAGSLVLPVATGTFGVGPTLVASAAIALAGGAVAFALIGRAGRAAPVAEAAAARAADLPIFAGVARSSLVTAFGRAAQVAVSAGTVVIRQGDPADRFYVILEGRFDVDQTPSSGGAPVRLRTMGPDEVFGEIGLLTGAPRTATVTAEADGRLLALDAPDFLELVTAGAELGPRLLSLRRGGQASGN